MYVTGKSWMDVCRILLWDYFLLFYVRIIRFEIRMFFYMGKVSLQGLCKK